MREEIIARHNSVVDKDDTTYHVGDMFWRTMEVRDAIDIMNRLNGVHIYVMGNHDELFESPSLRACFDSIHERVLIKPEGGPKYGIVLDHFAGRVWHHSDKGSWQLYGHTHAELPEIDPLLAFDVGVDANNYTPVSLTQVAERMAQKIARIQRGLGLRKP
jgi:calcineurin-like phosphoesterase family protein